MEMDEIEIRVVRPRGNESQDLPLPRYMSEYAVGMDLYADVTEEVILRSMETRLIPTGIAISIPHGFEGQVRPRSGLAVKHGITLINSPGTIDSDYRGEIYTAMINLSRESFTIKRGDRIAQLIIAPVVRAKWKLVDELDKTGRNDGGFGHTGRQ